MQMYLLRHRFVTYVAAVRRMASGQSQARGVILDRSVFSDSVFAVKNRLDGNISEEGFEYYLAQREKLLRFVPKPDLALFLDVAPQVCHDRVHSLRGRDCEGGIPLDYLSGLHDCYLEFMETMNAMGASAVPIGWNNFGRAEDVAEVILNHRAAIKPDAVQGRLSSLHKALFDDDEVIKALTPDYILEDAGDYEDCHGPEFESKVREQLAMGSTAQDNLQEAMEVERVARTLNLSAIGTQA